MDVSIIIVNYNTIRLTEQCIRSVIEHTKGVEYEIIVVDNNSGDDIETVIPALFGDSGCRIVCRKLRGNVGFGRGNNEGFKLASGKYLFCLNPDTILQNNAVRILSDFLERHRDTGACGGNLFSLDMRPNHSFRRMLPGIRWELDLLLFGKIERWLYGKDTEFNHSGRPLEVGYITGADLMMRRDVAEAVGGFSPQFFMYFEETDLCSKIRRQGYRIMSVPEARIVHLEGGSFAGDGHAEINTKAIERSECGRITYYRLNACPAKRWLLNAVYSTALWLNKTAFKLAGNGIWRYYESKRLAYRKALRQMK